MQLDSNVLIVGPTCSGKSDLAVKIAKLFYNTEVVSVDSMQVYRNLDIGTAKFKSSEMQGIKHHLIDNCSLSEIYNVGKFFADSCNIVKDKSKKFIFVGGTMMYANTLLNGLSSLPSSSLSIRKDYNNINSPWDELFRLDPIAAKKIEKNDHVRVIRAIELFKLTGLSQSANLSNMKMIDCNFKVITLLPDREALKRRLRERIALMIESGIVEETEKYVLKSVACHPVRKASGYKQVLDYFDDRVKYSELIDLIYYSHCQLAKRQYTWLRKTRSDISIKSSKPNDILEMALQSL